MKTYKEIPVTKQCTVTKKCTCDRCGVECDISNKNKELYSSISVYPQWGKDIGSYQQLCVKCTFELMNFFKKKDTTEEVDDMKFWLED